MEGPLGKECVPSRSDKHENIARVARGHRAALQGWRHRASARGGLALAVAEAALAHARLHLREERRHRAVLRRVRKPRVARVRRGGTEAAALPREVQTGASSMASVGILDGEVSTG